jgi:TonB family protein
MQSRFPLLVALLFGACVSGGDVESISKAFTVVGAKPDELPVQLNRTLPIRYPAAQYEQKIQGNVTLRLFIDKTGRVHPESTTVAEPSGYPALDTAAVLGANELQFQPAKLNGAPVDVTVLYPVFFRHPQAPPLPGDTILRHYQRPPPP